MLGAYFAWQVGTLSTWHQVVPILKGSSLPAVMGCIGWLFLRSPFAGKFTELLNIKSDPVTGQKEVTKLTIDSPTDMETKEQEK
jgi:hypothetical protein